jgi:hypothetical protein
MIPWAYPIRLLLMTLIHINGSTHPRDSYLRYITVLGCHFFLWSCCFFVNSRLIYKTNVYPPPCDGKIVSYLMQVISYYNLSRCLFMLLSWYKLNSYETCSDKKTFKIMTYNVWFREDIEVRRRMDALGGLIQYHSPDLICFQVQNSSLHHLVFSVSMCLICRTAGGYTIHISTSAKF